jgi:hypothetical protein
VQAAIFTVAPGRCVKATAKAPMTAISFANEASLSLERSDVAYNRLF